MIWWPLPHWRKFILSNISATQRYLDLAKFLSSENFHLYGTQYWYLNSSLLSEPSALPMHSLVPRPSHVFQLYTWKIGTRLPMHGSMFSFMHSLIPRPPEYEATAYTAMKLSNLQLLAIDNTYAWTWIWNESVNWILYVNHSSKRSIVEWFTDFCLLWETVQPKPCQNLSIEGSSGVNYNPQLLKTLEIRQGSIFDSQKWENGLIRDLLESKCLFRSQCWWQAFSAKQRPVE